MPNAPFPPSWLSGLQNAPQTVILVSLLALLPVLALAVRLFRQRKRRALPAQAVTPTDSRPGLLIQNIPTPLLIADLGPIKAACDALAGQGVTDIAAHFQRHPDQLTQTLAQVRVREANQAALRLYEVTDTPEAEVINRLPGLFQAGGQPLQPAELRGLLTSSSSETVCTIQSASGSPLTVERRISVPDEQADTWRQALIALTDITEQDRLRKRNLEFEQQLRRAQRLETIGSLAGGIAHDFNNILAPIMGRTELLLAENGENSTVSAHCHAILTASQRARDLVRQILTFSRQVDEAIQPVELAAVIREVERLLKPTLPATITIDCQLPGYAAHVMADTTQLHQVLMNLVTNSFHAMEDRGGRLTIALETVIFDRDQANSLSIVPGRYQQVTVTDTGHGMDRRILDKIFDPYFTTKARGKGTGLGLPVVLGILRGYGGEIRFHSVVGKGTACTLYLPAVEMTVPAGTKAAPAETALPTGTEHLLLVDDEKAIADVTSSMLERLGYRVTMRISSFDALEAFRNHADQIDLLITDLAMPQMSGLQLCSQIRRIRPDVKVIFCTGFSEQTQSRDPKATGIDGFLHKPVLMADLASCVRTVLDAPPTNHIPPEGEP